MFRIILVVSSIFIFSTVFASLVGLPTSKANSSEELRSSGYRSSQPLSPQATKTSILGPVGSGRFGSKVVVLPNGNFVVTDPNYDEGDGIDIGAAYLYNGATNILISTLKGSTTNDQVGLYVTVLANGNYVVSTPNWTTPGGFSNAGAATWCSSTTGCSGVVSVNNSIVGGEPGDNVGNASGAVDTGGIFVLTNGNYVVAVPFADIGFSNVGAVVWGNGQTGTTGMIATLPSIRGASSNDRIGASVTPLTNGNYVTHSSEWNNPTGPTFGVGAVTFANGSAASNFVVSQTNSLVASVAFDSIGNFNSVIPLNNGNYVVASPNWDSPPFTNVGAVTFGNGKTGVTGPISASNSVVGSSPNDQVGGGPLGGGGNRVDEWKLRYPQPTLGPFEGACDRRRFGALVQRSRRLYWPDKHIQLADRWQP